MRKKRASSLLSRQHWPMMPSHLSRSILFALLSVVPIASQAADKRGITEKDLFDFVWIGDPQISPDGSSIAYVLVCVIGKELGYDTAVWTVLSAVKEPPHRFTNGQPSSSPE